MSAIYNEMEDRIEDLEVALSDAIALLRFSLEYDTDFEMGDLMRKTADALAKIEKGTDQLEDTILIDATLAKIAELKDKS